MLMAQHDDDVMVIIIETGYGDSSSNQTQLAGAVEYANCPSTRNV